MNTNDYRKQQEMDAKKRFNNPGTSRPAANATGARKPFVPKGHDAYLKEAQDKREPLPIRTAAGEDFEGVVYARDKFTITILIKDPAGDYYRTFYKHALESFDRPVAR